MNYEFENRVKLKTKCFLRKLWIIKFLMQGSKTMVFYLNTRLQLFCLRLRSWWRKANLLWFNNKSLNIGRKEIEWNFLEYLDCNESNAWIRTKSLMTEPSSANGRSSIETLVGKNLPVVTEKNEFDYRHKSRMIFISFWKFWPQGLWWKDEKKNIFWNRTVLLLKSGFC